MTHTLVVGGTRGIGRAVVRRFASTGGNVSVLARHRSEPAPPAGVREWPVDLADADRIPPLLREIAEVQGPFDNIVLLQRFRGDGDPWPGELAVSLTATKRILEDGAPCFVTTGGAVVIVCSVASRLVATGEPAAYHAAKAALRQLARYYAVALGERGIRVNCVTPGAVLKEHGRGAAAAEALAGVTPLGRIATADDVAAAVAVLCGAETALVTGQELVVDGGLSLLLQEDLAQRLTRAAEVTAR